MWNNLKILLLAWAFSTSAYAQNDSTIFSFGGYVKADFLNTWYRNGDVGSESPMRDFHLPSQIPIGSVADNFNLDYHVKESRINFDVSTILLKKRIHGFVEMDFLLSGQGDERVSNSFSPRLRHFYFEWDRLLIGQTWSTFMVVIIPDDLDFAGAMDGIVFIRQPQIRYKAGTWSFAIENPETTVAGFQGSAITVTEKEVFPDVVVRKDFRETWGTWSVAAMYRTLSGKDTTDVVRRTSGIGITTGGKVLVGKRGDDFRMMATYGNGLGRYLSAGFIPGAVQEQSRELKAIGSLNGYIAYNHYWIVEKLSSSFNVAAFQAFHDEALSGGGVNEISYSASGNLKYTPIPELLFGVEFMHGYRETLDGTSGRFHRLQFSAKYWFGFKNRQDYEK